MIPENTAVTTILRIPGNWSDPRELIERIPDGCRLTPSGLVLPDQTEIELMPVPPDNQFAQIFRSACRAPAGEDELSMVDNYSVNIILSGPGGSFQSAVTMLQAGAAIIRAGGAGVFVDNSGLAHGGRDWMAMAEDGGHDAVSFAFVSIVRGQHELWTMGMQVLGLPDLAMKHADLEADLETFVDVIRYLSQGERPFGDGHVLAHETGPCFRAVATSSHSFDAPSPMHNPLGRLQLVSMKEIAESN
jgi:hypothetical protein